MSDNPPKNLAENDEIVKMSADFLLSEFNSLQDRAIGLEGNKSNRVNFMLILAAASLAGIGQSLSIVTLQTYLTSIIFFVALVILVLGLFTLQHNIDDSGAIVILFRRAARIRLWFVKQNKEIAGYVAFQYGDDRPKMDVPFLAFRGGEAVILVINTVALCAIVVVLSLPATWVIALAEIFVTAIIFWLAQNYYIHKALQKGEKMSAKSIRYPYAKMFEKYEK
ncbi:MAG: hypothetical protein L6461_01310 [Anaerolineae bacterium]|nr:hypothetical protein [Anaerolineae bacterium]